MENYRAIIEVMKFSDPSDVLRLECTVCSKWAEVSASRELWQSYLPSNTETEDQHPKHVFRQQFTQSVFVVTETKLLRLFLGARKWNEVALSRKVETDYMSSMTRVSLDRLLVCGGRARRENTFEVGVRSGQVCLLPALTPHRVAMGVLFFKGSVYAFCGKKGPQPSQNCDRFDTSRSVWSSIGMSQEKRAFFNPCLYDDLAYLCGGTLSKQACETYSFSTNSFARLSLELATPNAVSVCIGKTMHLVCNSKARRVKLGGRALNDKKKPLPKDLKPFFYSGFDPVVKNSLLIVVQRAVGRVVELDLSSLQWSAIEYPEEHMAPKKKAPVHKYKVRYINQFNPPPAPQAANNM